MNEGIAKGETIPQTVETLQAIMAADAERMEAMAKEIGLLKEQVKSLQTRLMKSRRAYDHREKINY